MCEKLVEYTKDLSLQLNIQQSAQTKKRHTAVICFGFENII